MHDWLITDNLTTWSVTYWASDIWLIFHHQMFWFSLTHNIISLYLGIIADLNFHSPAGSGVTFGGHVCSRQRDSRYAHPWPLSHCLHMKIKQHHADHLSLQHTSCTSAELNATTLPQTHRLDAFNILARVSYTLLKWPNAYMVLWNRPW